VPFLRWAGGKAWLVRRFPEIFPKSFGRYIEPFLGGGASFFFLRPERATLADTNGELIETYGAIKEDWKAVVSHLQVHQDRHCRAYYYEIRRTAPESVFGKAARFIYLNRTCWNGLYRVNLTGSFNVPIGTKQRVILETDDFEAVARLLRGVTLRKWGFEDTIATAERGDFLFVDPPYTVQHENNGFIKYNEKLFKWDDQVRLRDTLIRAVQKGAKVLLTNAAHSSVHDLYAGHFDVRKVSRHSVIAGTNRSRRASEELLIRSYE
jgi:DNA adenine methylase